MDVTPIRESTFRKVAMEQPLTQEEQAEWDAHQASFVLPTGSAVTRRTGIPQQALAALKASLPPAVTIVVYGNPAPQGSKRFVGVIKGHGMMVESSKKVKPWRQDVVAAAREAYAGLSPLDGSLAVRMVFTMPKPAGAPKRRRSWPNKKPDVSKLARSTEDALTTAGVWADDARVVQYDRLAKVFPGEDPESLESTGVRIEIRVMS